MEAIMRVYRQNNHAFITLYQVIEYYIYKVNANTNSQIEEGRLNFHTSTYHLCMFISYVGESVMSANGKDLPAGCYDAGSEGYLNVSRDFSICSYDDHTIIRQAGVQEREFVMSKSRKSDK